MSHSSLRNLISYFKKCVDHLKETEFSFDVLYLCKTCAFDLRVKEELELRAASPKVDSFRNKNKWKKEPPFLFT